MALNGDTIFQAAGNENTPGAPTVAPLPGGPTSGNGLGPHGARYSYMQVGHGGYESGGDHTGDITIRSQGGEFYLQAARAFGNDDPSAEWHQGMVYAYAQVGHGGARSGGDMSGDITIVAADTARMIAGAGEQTYVQVGHGGYDANVFSGAGSMHEPDTRVGNVSGNTDRRGAHLQNWYNPAYDILTNSVGGYIRTDVARLDNGVPDINGRVNDPSLYQTVTGDITIVAGNGVEVKATDQGTSSGNNSYASVGHGGAFTQGNNSDFGLTAERR